MMVTVRNMTTVKAERLELHHQGLSAAEIARRTGYEQATIAMWLTRHGYKPNGGHGGYRVGCGRKRR